MYNEVFINELTELLERKFFLLPFKVLMANLIIELTSDRLTGEKKFNFMHMGVLHTHKRLSESQI